MKELIFLLVFFGTTPKSTFDIAPHPIIAKGIITSRECNIQMVSEVVTADLYKDSSHVSCIFQMENMGEATQLDIGFPVMEFQYWSLGGYTPDDKSKFMITVDGQKINHDQIRVPHEIEDLYKAYVNSNDGVISGDMLSEFSQKVESGQFPWYIWQVSFDKGEKREIKVSYKLPSGMISGAKYRYFNYLLNTGAGWFGKIEQADIILKVHDIKFENIEKIVPAGYTIDNANKVIKWKFTNLEPTKDDDIYVQYFNVKERRKYVKYQNKKRKMFEKAQRKG